MPLPPPPAPTAPCPRPQQHVWPPGLAARAQLGPRCDLFSPLPSAGGGGAGVEEAERSSSGFPAGRPAPGISTGCPTCFHFLVRVFLVCACSHKQLWVPCGSMRGQTDSRLPAERATTFHQRRLRLCGFRTWRMDWQVPASTAWQRRMGARLQSQQRGTSSPGSHWEDRSWARARPFCLASHPPH